MLTGDPGPGVAALRQELITAAAAIPPGRSLAGADPLADAVLWAQPLTYPDSAMAREHLTAAWAEGAAMGVLAAGAVTTLGRALLTGDGAAITAVAHNLMPAVRTTATFQSDLTAMVAGTPAADLIDLLGSVADLEARGSATVWRFSPASVRRALDGGATADELLAALGRVADRELPQPLTYLLRDVGRRHGHVAVLPLGSAVVSGDAALLAEICASRSLADLKLRSLAPTVLASGAPVQQTLRRLRAAGYVPVAHDANGNVAVERAPTRRAPSPARAGTHGSPPGARMAGRRGAQRAAGRTGAQRAAGRGGDQGSPVDAMEVARRLARSAADPRASTDSPAHPGASADSPADPRASTDSPAVLSSPADTRADAPTLFGTLADSGRWEDAAEFDPGTADQVRRLADHLSEDDVRVLAHAVEHGDPVHICCTDARGRHVDQTVSDLVLVGTQLIGWCHRSKTQRTFALDDIGAVAVA